MHLVQTLAGYLVMRCYCKQKEQRRQRMFEKALDAAATSPFARGITRWLLAGVLAYQLHALIQQQLVLVATTPTSNVITSVPF